MIERSLRRSLLLLLLVGLPSLAAAAEPAPADEAPRAAAAGDAACACLPQPALPVAMRAGAGSDGWTLHFDFPPFSPYTDLFVRLDSYPEESTGHERPLDVMTGKPMIRTWIIVPYERVKPGEHTVTVRMVRADGSVEGPHALRFHPGEEKLAAAKSALAFIGDRALSFAEHGEDVTWLFFSYFFGIRESLKELRWSVDDCSLGQRLVFDAPPDPARPPPLTEERPYLTLPLTTRSACAQVVFSDGTLSPVFKIERQPRRGGR